MGYIFLLRRLAYVSFLNQKYKDSEKYFKVIQDLIPEINNTALNIFAAKKNLLILYSHIDLNKAMDQADQMKRDSENNDYLPMHKRELDFMIANIYTLNGDFKTSKNMYRNLLKNHSNEEVMAGILNNLAYSSKNHYKQLA